MSHPMLRLFWLALGAFAIGTEGFMIAGLLPEIAGRRDLPCRPRANSSPPSP